MAFYHSYTRPYKISDGKIVMKSEEEYTNDLKEELARLQRDTKVMGFMLATMPLLAGIAFISLMVIFLYA